MTAVDCDCTEEDAEAEEAERDGQQQQILTPQHFKQISVSNTVAIIPLITPPIIADWFVARYDPIGLISVECKRWHVLSNVIGILPVPTRRVVHFASLYKLNSDVVVMLLGFVALHALAPPWHTAHDPLDVVHETQFELHALSVHTVIPICCADARFRSRIVTPIRNIYLLYLAAFYIQI
jgi:hypothetical protein